MLLVPACGGDDDGLTIDEFRSRVNGLCATEHDRIDDLFGAFPDDPSSDDVVAAVGGLARIFEDFRDGLRAAGPPEGREEQYRAYLDLWDAHVARVRSAAGDEDLAAALFEEEPPDPDPLATLERDLGLDVCASR